MAVRRDAWDEIDTIYSSEQVESVLNTIGIEVVGETVNDFLALCPYHGNTDTPSFSVSKSTGKNICFSPSCMEFGSLVELVTNVNKCSHFEAMRLILKGRVERSFKDDLKKALNPEPEFKPFSQDTLDKMYDFFWLSDRAQEYMHGRGFDDDTLRDFRIGYSVKKDMVIVPMHAPDGMPVGLVGRSIVGKSFKNSVKLPRSKTAWNFNRARRSGSDTVIIVESSFDAMRIHQAGYPNVVAILGGYMSADHFRQLDRTFRTIINMTDNDDKRFDDPCRKCIRSGLNLCRGHRPGRDFGHTIATGFRGKRVLWASYDTGVIYPEGKKDACDMTDDEIRQCIKNAVPHLEYTSWNLDK